jgi:hypothetical protein
MAEYLHKQIGDTNYVIKVVTHLQFTYSGWFKGIILLATHFVQFLYNKRCPCEYEYTTEYDHGTFYAISQSAVLPKSNYKLPTLAHKATGN